MTKLKKPWWKRLIKSFLWLLLLPIILLLIIIGLVHYNQDALVQKGLSSVNKSFVGEIKLEDSHISLFHDFPNITIELNNLELFESKESNAKRIALLNNIFVNFDLAKLTEGKYIVNNVELQKGLIEIVQDTTDNLNILKALQLIGPIDTVKSNEVLNLKLSKVTIQNVVVKYFNEKKNSVIDANLKDLTATLRSEDTGLGSTLVGNFGMTFIKDKDTTFINNKTVNIDASIIYDKKKEILSINHSKLSLQGISFATNGFITLKGNPYMSLNFNGQKTNFDLIFSFLPPETAAFMKRYKNSGIICFEADLKGVVGIGKPPAVSLTFGCHNGYFKNTITNKVIDKVSFRGYFNMGAERASSTYECGIVDLFAHPEHGDVRGNIKIRNFDDPDVNMDLSTDFDLKFLAEFLEMKSLKNLSGQIKLKMNYNEMATDDGVSAVFSKLKEGIDSELEVKNFSVKIPNYPFPVKNVNLHAEMKNKNLFIDNCTASIGSSDISLTMGINNLPAIFHHKDTPLDIHTVLQSKQINIKELTSYDTLRKKPIDENITDFQMALTFKTFAKNFTDTNMILPHGEFYIDNFYAKLHHYPHSFHDFKADIIIDSTSLAVKDLKGQIDESDFDFTGRVDNYPLWFAKDPFGMSEIHFNYSSNKLNLHDVFSYKGENYVPKEYRHEEFDDLKIKGRAKMFYSRSFESFELDIDDVQGKAKIHPMKLEKVHGVVKFKNEHLDINNFSGKLGNSDFKLNLVYVTSDKIDERKKDNHFELIATKLNFDELMNYTPHIDTTAKATAVLHDSVFNVFSLPFSNMKIKFIIGDLLYHNIHLKNINSNMRMQKNHYFYIDTLSMDAADGHIDVDGYFNGSDKSKIYFAPNIRMQDVDLAKLMLKFDNFGQEYLVNNNISGHLTGMLNGKVRMHTDLMPIMDESEITMKTSLTNGALKNYAPMQLMKDYFKDKNLNNILFDTLQNTFEIKKGVMYIPSMNINSSLGFIEISGKQAFTSDMDYKIKVPMKMVTDVGFKYLFGKKREEVDSSQVDGIVYRDKDKKIKFVNINIKGNSDDFKISIGK